MLAANAVIGFTDISPAQGLPALAYLDLQSRQWVFQGRSPAGLSTLPDGGSRANETIRTWRLLIQIRICSRRNRPPSGDLHLDCLGLGHF